MGGPGRDPNTQADEVRAGRCRPDGISVREGSKELNTQAEKARAGRRGDTRDGDQGGQRRPGWTPAEGRPEAQNTQEDKDDAIEVSASAYLEGQRKA